MAIGTKFTTPYSIQFMIKVEGEILSKAEYKLYM